MKPKTWVCNDYRTTIPGSKTLWHDLGDWLDAPFVGGPFNMLGGIAEAHYFSTHHSERPQVIVRNGSYFRPIKLDDCKQIGLFQDILSGFGRTNQLQVMRDCVPVFNSAWTQAQFPEAENGKIIPLPVDFDLFKPLPKRDDLRKKWGILPNSICWVGANSKVKGADILGKLIAETDFNWCIVTKDEVNSQICKQHGERVRLFSRVPQKNLVEIINACSVGLCTSRVETQHLAGLEIGACGLPLVTTNVGAYFGRLGCEWGDAVPEKLLKLTLETTMDGAIASRPEIRAYWLSQGYDRKSCREAWVKLVESLV